MELDYYFILNLLFPIIYLLFNINKMIDEKEPEKTTKVSDINSITKQDNDSIFEYISEEKEKEVKDYILDPSNEIWNVIRDDNITALHNACILDKYSIIEIIVEQTKIRLNLTNSSILNEEEKKSKKRIFLNFINAKTKQDSLTALHYASFRGNIKVIKLLIKNGAEINALTNHGLNMIHKAAQGDKPSAIIYFNKKYKMDLKAKDENQLNALHLAVKSGMENSVIFLLALGIDPNEKDKDGFTALHYAVKSGNKRIIKKLLQKGASNLIRENQNNKLPQDMSKNPEIKEIFRKKGICEILFFHPNIGQKTCFSNINIILFIILHVFIIFCNFFILIPYFLSTIFSIIYIVVSILVFVLYISLSFSNPGRMKNDLYKDLLDIVENVQDISNYCPYCLVKKNFRSLHCLICQKCIEEFDHHCFWVGNCIGKNNYVLFFIFLIYILVNTLFNIVLIIIYFVKKIAMNNEKVNNNNSFPRFLLCSDNCVVYSKIFRIIVAVLCLIISLSFFFPLIMLFRMQLNTVIERRKLEKEEKEYEKDQLRAKIDEEKWETLIYNGEEENKN